MRCLGSPGRAPGHRIPPRARVLLPCPSGASFGLSYRGDRGRWKHIAAARPCRVDLASHQPSMAATATTGRVGGMEPSD
ncbi:MAG: hypothetical protein ACRDV9_07590, partial [Acidimicrobiia bacterium]